MRFFYLVVRTVFVLFILTGVLNFTLFFRYHDNVGLVAVIIRTLISILLLVSVRQRPADQEQEEDSGKSISTPKMIMLVLVFLLSQAVISEHLATVASLSKTTIQVQRP